MMSGENIVGIVAVVMIFGGGGLRYAVGAVERLVTLKMTEGSRRNEETLKVVEQLRLEVAALRDTTTRYDLSADAAITNLEQRMEFVEGRSMATATAYAPLTVEPTTTAEQPSQLQNVGRGV